METITEILSKSKRLALGEIFVPLVILLVGFASFGLGRLSVQESATDLVQINEFPAEMKTDNIAGAASIAAVVGSQNSDKYHFPWCSGAQRIAEKNLVTFASIEAARAAGYTPAGNCEGLE